MSDVMARISAHFSALGKKRMEVPEWGGPDGPLVLFAEPMTVGDRSRVYRHAKNDSLEFLVRTIVLKAKDAEGQPVFDVGDVHGLMTTADARVVERVANEIMCHGAPDGRELGN
jgi:hypothetical protein